MVMSNWSSLWWILLLIKRKFYQIKEYAFHYAVERWFDILTITFRFDLRKSELKYANVF